jgi:hypothetical protein
VGIICLYSKTHLEIDPLLVSLLQKAALLLSASELDPSILEHIDVENLMSNSTPSISILPSTDTLQPSVTTAAPYTYVSKSAPDFVIKGTHSLT